MYSDDCRDPRGYGIPVRVRLDPPCHIVIVVTLRGWGWGWRGGTGAYAIGTPADSESGAAEPPQNGVGGLSGYAGGDDNGRRRGGERVLLPAAPPLDLLPEERGGGGGVRVVSAPDPLWTLTSTLSSLLSLSSESSGATRRMLLDRVGKLRGRREED